MNWVFRERIKKGQSKGLVRPSARSIKKMRTLLAYVFREIEQTTYGEYRYEAQEKNGEKMQIKCLRPLPFLDGDALYHVCCEGSSEDAFMKVVGVLRVIFPAERDVRKAVLTRTIVGEKNGLRRMGKCLSAESETDFCQRISLEFGKDARDAYARNKRKSLGGAPDVSQAALRSALVCVGFYDRDISKVLLSLSDPEEEKWFLPTGAPIKEEEEVLENFCDLVASARKNAEIVAQKIDEMIKRDPEEFFSCATRPMCVRALGNIHSLFYETYCGQKLAVPVEKENMMDVRSDVVDPFVVGASAEMKDVMIRKKVVVQVSDFMMRRAFIAAVVTVMKFAEKKRLAFAEEKGEDVDTGELKNAFDNNCGDRGQLSEVHAFCAEKKIMLKFVEGKENIEKQRLTFLNGKRTLDAAFVVRDAHLLQAEEFSHLFWKISKRIKFKRMELTYRLDWDQSFGGKFWRFIRILKENVAPSVQKAPHILPRPSEENLYAGGLDAAPHVCVVPTAASATAEGEAETNDWAFSPRYSLFGKIMDSKKGVAVLKTPTGLRKTLRSAELYKCKVNRRGAPLVPVAALAAVARKAKRQIWPRATLVVPSDFGPDEIDQTKRIVTKIASAIDFWFSGKKEKDEKKDERELKVLKELLF